MFCQIDFLEGSNGPRANFIIRRRISNQDLLTHLGNKQHLYSITDNFLIFVSLASMWRHTDTAYDLR